MARNGFYDENRGRGYPLLAGVVGQDAPSVNPGEARYLPLETLIDFGCVMGLDSEFVEDEHSAFLYRVSRTGDIFTFEFRTTAPGIAGSSLTFQRHLAAASYSVEYVDDENSENSADSDSPCPGDPGWTGFLVTGDLAPLAEVLTSGNSLLGGEDYRVEPGLIRSLVSSYVRSVSVANGDRTRAESAAGCKPLCWPIAVADYYVQRRCLQGNLRFQEGHNSVIRADAAKNAIEFSASVGAGAGEVCDEVPVVVGEEPPIGSDLLTGGLKCNETVRSINGVGGPRVTLTAGKGVSMTVVPSQSLLQVNVNFNDTPGCNEVSTTEDDCDQSDESDDSDAPEDECDCGPLEAT